MVLILNRRTLIHLQQYNNGKIGKIFREYNINIFAKYGHESLIKNSYIKYMRKFNWIYDIKFDLKR